MNLTRTTIIVLAPLVVIGFSLGAYGIVCGCEPFVDWGGPPAPVHDPYAVDHPDAVPLYMRRDAGQTD